MHAWSSQVLVCCVAVHAWCVYICIVLLGVLSCVVPDLFSFGGVLFWCFVSPSLSSFSASYLLCRCFAVLFGLSFVVVFVCWLHMVFRFFVFCFWDHIETCKHG